MAQRFLPQSLVGDIKWYQSIIRQVYDKRSSCFNGSYFGVLLAFMYGLRSPSGQLTLENTLIKGKSSDIHNTQFEKTVSYINKYQNFFLESGNIENRIYHYSYNLHIS